MQHIFRLSNPRDDTRQNQPEYYSTNSLTKGFIFPSHEVIIRMRCSLFGSTINLSTAGLPNILCLGFTGLTLIFMGILCESWGWIAVRLFDSDDESLYFEDPKINLKLKTPSADQNHPHKTPINPTPTLTKNNQNLLCFANIYEISLMRREIRWF